MRTIIGLALAWGVAAHAQTLPAPPTSPAPVRNYEYDAQGNLTRVIQAPGVAGFDLRTTNTYDRLERLKDSTDPKNGVTNLEYDGLDRPTKVTDPKRLATQYIRNGLGDTKQQVSPDTGTTNLTYDAAGNLRSYTDARGVSVTLHYDEISRLKMASYAQTGQTTVYHQWQYDRTDVPHGIGRLGNVLHPAGSWNYSYDAWGNILSNRQQLTAVTGGNAAQLNHTVAYGYDSGNNVASITYPSGRKLTITRDRGAITGMSLAKDAASTPTPLISEVSWAPFGPVKSWKWHLASGIQVHERLYDNWGRPVRYRIGDTIRDLSYDAADRISGYTHYDAATAAATPALNQGFQYDELGRLKHVTLNAGYWSFEYDANGNRTKATASGTTSDYTIQATSNRIASITNPARSFSYDNVGNTTADGNFTATYDLPGRVKTLTKAGITTTYTYDPEGKRIRKFSSTGAASTIVFVYDQWGHLLGEYDNTGKAIREFVWLGDTPVAVFTPDPAAATNPPLVFFIHTDHLSAPRVVLDKANKVRWRWIAEAFGVSAPETNPSGLGVFTFNLRFPGQYFDQESGLHDNWWRTYDPNVGRYVQSDPIGLAGGINTYAYVAGNPLTYIDPLGLQAQPKPVSETAPAQQAPVPRSYPPAANDPSYSPSGVPFWTRLGVGLALLCAPANVGQPGAACADDPYRKRQECRDNDCAVLLYQMNEQISLLLRSHRHFRRDKHGKQAAGGTVPAGYAQKWNDLIRGLQNLINVARERGCPVPPEAEAWLSVPMPKFGDPATTPGRF